ncbi:MAG: O-antigen ligase family protein [Limnobacter sp.]|nr:O-antigen ligase family protein [Limnobacter sp.]
MLFACAPLLILAEHCLLPNGQERFSTRLLNINLAGVVGALYLLFFGGLAMAANSRWLKVLWAVSALAGGYISMASETRSAWASVLVGVVLLIVYRLPGFKRQLVALVGAVLLGAVLLHVSVKVESRVQEAGKEFQDWVAGLNKDTSTGIRLSLYHGALAAAAEHPLVGYGEAAQFEMVRERGLTELYQTPGFAAKCGCILAYTITFLDRLLTHGVVGMLLTLFLFLLPLRWFSGVSFMQLKALAFEDAAILYLGFCTSVVYTINGLTLNFGPKFLHSFFGFVFVLACIVWVRQEGCTHAKNTQPTNRHA